MNKPNDDQDPWNRIRYEEMPPDRIKFSKGEIAFWTVAFIAVIGGISLSARSN